MNQHKNLLLLSSLILLALIISIAIANIVNGNGYYLFYNLIYGIFLSTMLPLWLCYKENNTITSLGIKRIGINQLIVTLGFIVFSVGGQLVSIKISSIDIKLILVGFIPMAMTTFFEEFLFRGYMQTRFEKQYGWITAVFLSGLFFSLYHIGYHGFRTISDISLLFIVGIGFAMAYKLSNGNVIVSYFVNLPNAILTYALKSEKFPVFNSYTIPLASVTILIVLIIMITFTKKFNFHNDDPV